MLRFGYMKRGGQARFAEKHGVKPPNVNGYLSGAQKPEPDKASKMADDFGVNPQWFLLGAGKAPDWYQGRETKVEFDLPQRTKIQGEEGDVAALQIGIESLAVGILKALPRAAQPFLDDLKEAATARGFSRRVGLLRILSQIALASGAQEEEDVPRAQRRGSGPNRKP